MDFESKLNELEAIVGRMEKGQLTLEESLKSFEDGIRLSRECQKQLEETELKVKKLLGFEPDGKPRTEDFRGLGD